MKKGKKKAGKIVLIVLGTIIAVTALFAAISIILTSAANKRNTALAQSFAKIENPEATVPTLGEDGNYEFITDRDLKILQLTDVHIGGGWMSEEKDAKAINAVASMITAEKPDLVIVTGDISFPVPFISGTFNNMNSAKIFAELMETLGVYWTLTFGNHDTESYSFYSREKISEFYGSDSLKYCLFRDDDEVDGYGNSIINVKNSNGIITQSLFMLDSHSYTGGDWLGLFQKYDKIHDNQIEWYTANAEKLSEHNKILISELYSADRQAYNEALAKYGVVSTLTFMHIPPREFKEAIDEYIANGCSDTKNVKFHYGFVGEKDNGVYCSNYDDGLFEAMQEHKGTAAIFCGHDHLNTISLSYKNIRLTYGNSIDYLAYSGISNQYKQRGCTVITVRPDGTFGSSGESYYQDKYKPLNGSPKEQISTAKAEN